MDLEEVFQDSDLSDGLTSEGCRGGLRIYEKGASFGHKL